MTLAEFNTLELNKKADLVWEWGHYLTSRKTEQDSIALFLIGDFLAEVYISPGKNQTENIKGISLEDIAPEFRTLINYEDPFLKALSTRKNSQPRIA